MSVELIAEVAQGYQGDISLARLLARAAARAKADAVKFQLVYADEIATPDYQYYDLFRSLEMPIEAWKAVIEEAKTNGIQIYLDIYGNRSLEEALTLGVDGIKIHSTDFFNVNLVDSALDRAPRVFVSLGGIAVAELEEFIHIHRLSPDRPVYFMYGFQAEPTPVASNNLRRLGTLTHQFPGYRFGFMDHSEGGSDEAMSLALMALPFGINCIEKHITLERILELEDFASALSPLSFYTFVNKIKSLEKALGTDDLMLMEEEQEYRRKALKVVVATRELKKDEVLTREVLSLKRINSPPASSFFRIEKVTSRKLLANVRPNQPILEEMLACDD
jgi:N,N'-diacetyllegionaminate synthase